MAENQYIYAVARIRSKELTLFNKTFINQLLACKEYKDCLRLLSEKGWGQAEDETAEQILAMEREKTWELMQELVEDMSVFDTFLYANDFHNLKAAIKQVYLNKEIPNIYITHGTIAVDLIIRAVKEHDFSILPEYMQLCAEEAYYVQLRTGDSQLCDLILDKAALDTIYKKSKESGNQLLAEYAELKVAASDINIVLRGYKTKKGKDFYERALSECQSLDKTIMIESILEGEETLYKYLETTVYADAVPEIKKSLASFERWCDNVIITHILPQKYNPFTLSPLVAYILARENEVKSVRILLSGKLNELPENSIRERLREMYV